MIIIKLNNNLFYNLFLCFHFFINKQTPQIKIEIDPKILKNQLYLFH